MQRWIFTKILFGKVECLWLMLTTFYAENLQQLMILVCPTLLRTKKLNPPEDLKSTTKLNTTVIQKKK